MSWIFKQSTGWLLASDGSAYQGYSGAEPFGLNNPDAQDVPNVGPIPQGTYTIEAPIDTTTHGPYALPLIPAAGNQMFGRGGFMIHGDEVAHPGQHLASEGCIIVDRKVREAIWASEDRELEVVA